MLPKTDSMLHYHGFLLVLLLALLAVDRVRGGEELSVAQVAHDALGTRHGRKERRRACGSQEERQRWDAFQENRRGGVKRSGCLVEVR